MRRGPVVLQQVRLSQMFPQAIWHPEPWVRRLLSDAAADTGPTSTPFLVVLSLLLLLPSPGKLGFPAATATGDASSGWSVAEWIP